MKLFFSITIIAVIICSCDTKRANDTLAKKKAAQDSISAINQKNYVLAKEKAKEVFTLMNDYTNEAAGRSGAKIKELAKKWDKKMRPAQKSLDSLKALLSDFDRAKIDAYRQELLNLVQSGKFNKPD